MGGPDSRRLYLIKVVALAAVYYGAAKLGLSLAFAAPSVTAIWPPTGIALAALILWGYRVWPGVALGALLANSWTGVPFYTVGGIALGNTLEALAGAYLLCEVGDFRPSLERVVDVISLAILAGAVSTAISATVGVTSLLIGNEIGSGDIGSVWRTWWLGDMGGDLIVAPALLVAATQWPFRRAPGRPLEAVALALLAGGLSAVVFSSTNVFPYVLFPLLVWGALRFWQPGAAGATLLVAAIAIPLTEHDLGPFSGHSPDDRLLLAQTFLGVAGLTALVLAAVISERRRAEEAAERIAATLQESLLPTHLPAIPGIETAVDFRAAGERHLVGGDFYDVFEGEDGAWAVVVGDVLGKGATAAATTGLARYTLRAAAVQERRPSRVLGLLNDAILKQSPDQFCTVAYGRLELEETGGVSVTLSVGGHPLPLVLRADGQVEPVGRPGTLLGVLPRPELADHRAHLDPGDALVFYTDGLTEAYAPGRIVKRAALVAALQSSDGHRDAAAIVSEVEAAALGDGGGEPRDDIVLLVLRVMEEAPREAGSHH
ncbi:MAG TPA: MASE1 domain-containing protein [Solirubrobacterales bacterium]|nr:MASE1 domain-containing protein [Solirubrobacterales bacterium]